MINLGLPEELSDRGLIYERLECAQSARGNYRRFIELEQDALGARVIRSRMINLQKISPALH